MNTDAYTLENTYWCLKIAKKGAWIQSLAARSPNGVFEDLLVSGHESLPLGSETWQHAGMPLLFPFAGRSYTQGEEGFIRFENQNYPMPIHGFAHSHNWKVEKVDSCNLVLSLSSEQTKQFYPFSFELQYHISIVDRRLRCEIKVKNLNQDPLPLSAGWHPYFLPQNLPFDAIRTFIGNQSAYRVNSLGLISPSEKIETPFNPADPAWQSAIVKCTDKIQLAIRENIMMDCDPDLKVITIWCPQPEKFVCLEPWMTPPNSFMEGYAKKIAAQQTLSSHIDFICF